eukprot:1781656-Rhodomonas_salina.3
MKVFRDMKALYQAHTESVCQNASAEHVSMCKGTFSANINRQRVAAASCQHTRRPVWDGKPAPWCPSCGRLRPQCGPSCLCTGSQSSATLRCSPPLHPPPRPTPSLPHPIPDPFSALPAPPKAPLSPLALHGTHTVSELASRHTSPNSQHAPKQHHAPSPQRDESTCTAQDGHQHKQLVELG